ncbi:MAG TPA: hypothetical protein VE619_08405 [Nitrososphaeraceae archaeon]|nr:hypothetical protein [Nitrososphaeraceae archaeon]
MISDTKFRRITNKATGIIMTDMEQLYEQIVIGAIITSANQPSIYRFTASKRGTFST